MSSFNYINPVAFHLGNAEVRWYAIFILSGIIIAMWQGLREGRKLGIYTDWLFYNIVICVPIAIVGARFWYVLFNISDFMRNGTFDIAAVFGLEGGLSGLGIQGGVIAAFIYVILVARKSKYKLYRVFDVLAPGLLIGQILGRWGNFCNHELYGQLVNNTELFHKLLPSFITENMYISGKYLLPGLSAGYYHPMFLYESMGNLVGLIIMLVARRKFKFLKSGDLAGFYLIWYGIVRTCTESFRHNGEVLLIPGTNLRISIIMSIVFIVLGLSFLIIKRFVGNKEGYLEVLNEVKKTKRDSIIIDLEGALYDDYSYATYCLSIAFSEFDEQAKGEYTALCLGTLAENPPSKLEIEKIKNDPATFFKKYAVEGVSADMLATSFQKHYKEELNMIKPYKSLVDTIKLLAKRQYAIIIVSSRNSADAREALDKLKLYKYVNAIISNDNVRENSLGVETLQSAIKAYPERKKPIYITSFESRIKLANSINLENIMYIDNSTDLAVDESKDFETASNYYINNFIEIKKILVE